MPLRASVFSKLIRHLLLYMEFFEVRQQLLDCLALLVMSSKTTSKFEKQQQIRSNWLVGLRPHVTC